MIQNNNIHKQSFHLTRNLVTERNGYSSKVVWFTGLSGSGKSTLANEISKLLFEEKVNVFVLDGDNTRLGINKDLGFSLGDRNENIRRVAEIAKLFIESGTVVLCCFISPMEENRLLAKEIIGKKDFIEIFVDCPIENCEQRDVKGLYAKARSGEIKNFTGIDSPFERPTKADITVNTSESSIQECTEKIYNLLKTKIHE